MMIVNQLLAKMIASSQLLEEIMAMVRLDLIVIVWSTVKSQENWKVKKYLN